MSYEILIEYMDTIRYILIVITLFLIVAMSRSFEKSLTNLKEHEYCLKLRIEKLEKQLKELEL